MDTEENGQEYGYCTAKRWSVNLADWGLAVVHILVTPVPFAEREPIWRFAQVRRMDARRDDANEATVHRALQCDLQPRFSELGTAYWQPTIQRWATAMTSSTSTVPSWSKS